MKFLERIFKKSNHEINNTIIPFPLVVTSAEQEEDNSGKHLSDAAIRLQSLTPREREVLDLLLQGKKLREIAVELGTTYSTANFHYNALYKKLAVNSRAQLFMDYVELERAERSRREQPQP